MRAFVAIFPPPEIQKETLASARTLPSEDRVRWTRPDNVHLTLKFLGDIREEDLGDLRAALGEVCEMHTLFDVELAGLGAFPSARRAKVLWAGVGAGSDRLRSLATDIDAALAPLGFEGEKRSYVPHLTLGRVRGRPVSLDLPTGAGGIEFRVRQVELMESTLSSEGAIYGTLEVFALKGGEYLKGDQGADVHQDEE